ncbi:MAG: CHAT domain-containing tetratricopeptide repeat protein [Bacteroidota bacterium]
MRKLFLTAVAFALAFAISAQPDLEGLSIEELSKKMEKAFIDSDFELAIFISQKTLKLREDKFGKESAEYGQSIDDLGVIHHHKGDLGKAKEYLLASVENGRKYLPPGHSDLGLRLNNLGMLYRDLGEYEKAIPLFPEAIEAVRNGLGEEHVYYGILLNNHALIHEHLGQYEEAIEILKTALEITELTVGKEHYKYGIRLHNIGANYNQLFQFDTAITYLEASSKVLKAALGEQHYIYGNSLRELSSAYASIGRYNDAIQLINKVETIFINSIGKETVEYIVMLIDAGAIYAKSETPEKALPRFTEAIELTNHVLGYYHSYSSRAYHHLARTQTLIGQYEAANESYLAMIEMDRVKIRKLFGKMSEKDQISMAVDINDGLSDYLSFLKNHPHENEDLIIAYEHTILQKGLALGNRMLMMETLRRTSDSILQQNLEEWNDLTSKLSAEYLLPSNNRSADFENMVNEAEVLELALIQRSVAFREASEIISLEDISGVLGKDEAAIEFVYAKHSGEEAGDYLAFIIKGDGTPISLLSIFSENEIQSLRSTRKLYNWSSNSDFTNLNELIWKPIANELGSVKRLYYAPAGILHKINFSAIPISETSTIGESFQLHRLGSTRHLAFRSQENVRQGNEAVLFGGIEYDHVRNGETISREIASFQGNTNAERGFLAEDGSMMPFEYLEWTAKETDNLAEQLYTKNWRVSQNRGFMASEPAFKSIGVRGLSPRVIHLSTHGYFFSKPANNTVSSEAGGFRYAENPMIRAGLAMAGANEVWLGGSLDAGKDDGVLTAYEIAKMDLSNTELVVLSACETGLGDLVNNEGIFGLQRAFRIAGAKYVLMSLWNVKDQQTYEFMTAFYDGFLSGKPIPEAYQAAQNTLKSRYMHPFNPSLWAGFVLIE